MTGITLIVRKKFLVSTRRRFKHMYRSDWKIVCQINKEDSVYLFKYLNRETGFESDSQFIRWTAERYGLGDYSILISKNGMKGLKSFLHFRCFEEGYERLKSKPRFIKKIVYDEEESDYLELEQEKAIHRGCYPYLHSCVPIFNVIHAYDEIPKSLLDEEL